MSTMLDFYRAHGISPVTQDVSDLQAHFQRRAFLYRQLGLPPMAITGKDVLEVGPGTGDNARYTASLEPNSYVLLEPNPAGREVLQGAFGIGEVSITSKRIEDYPGYERFDVVLCEGLLGLCGSDPKVLLEHVAKHVKTGGVLVITCIDAISDCAEVLRRAMAQKYINKNASLQENVETLKPIFAPHLATLKGMTRSVDDWILDNILNPASIGPTFSIPDALSQLDGRFEVLGCSPRFLMDWRWYKEGQAGNAAFIEAYWRQAHNLYDYRQVSRECERWENEELMSTCTYIREDIAAIEQGRGGHVDTTLVENDPAWFGRGQQYLSLVKV